MDKLEVRVGIYTSHGYFENLHYILHTLVFFAQYQHIVPLSPEQKCELREVGIELWRAQP